MITTTYKCDHCGHTQNKENDPRQFWIVQVRYSSGAHVYGSTSGWEAKTANWCRTCMSKFGLMDTNDKGKPTPKPEPEKTMEDFVREIVVETIQEGP